MDFDPKPTFEQMLKMMSETMRNLDDLPFMTDDEGDYSFDPFAGLNMPDEPWYGAQKEQLSWDIRDFEPYETSKQDFHSQNREKQEK
mgnify:CR=1 FL=1|jgi:hypothetical protein